MYLIRSQEIFTIHEAVIKSHELQGVVKSKSLKSIVFRVENRMRYGMIGDAFDLAATYAMVIARGHVFNDANKRTAFVTMDICLRKNGIFLDFRAKEISDIIIDVAQGIKTEMDLACYLRNINLQTA